MANKKIVSILAVLIIFGSVATPVFAANDKAHDSDWFSGFVTFMSQKFGLDKAKVQSAVNEYHTQKVADRQKSMQDKEKKRLDALVKQGKITSDQEVAILKEFADLKSKYPLNPGDTREKRQQNMLSMINDWKAWAKSQNLDPKVLMVGPFGEKGGFRGFGKHGDKIPKQ